MESRTTGHYNQAGELLGVAAPCVLSGNRLDVRRLLDWALTCKTPIDAATAQTGARVAGLCYSDDVTNISIKLLDAMTLMMADSLIPVIKNCGEGHGLELWRSFAARWQGRSNQALAATLRAYITPARCATTMK